MLDPLDATDPLEESDEPESIVAPVPELLPELGLLLFVPDPPPFVPLDPAPLLLEPLDWPLLDIGLEPDPPLPFAFPLLPLPLPLPLDPEVEEHAQTIPRQAKRDPLIHFISILQMLQKVPLEPLTTAR